MTFLASSMDRSSAGRSNIVSRRDFARYPGPPSTGRGPGCRRASVRLSTDPGRPAVRYRGHQSGAEFVLEFEPAEDQPNADLAHVQDHVRPVGASQIAERSLPRRGASRPRADRLRPGHGLSVRRRRRGRGRRGSSPEWCCRRCLAYDTRPPIFRRRRVLFMSATSCVSSPMPTRRRCRSRHRFRRRHATRSFHERVARRFANPP